MAGLIALAWAVPAAAEGPIYCGFAQELCECSALFAVLETADQDAEFEAMLRRKSDALRQQVYIWHGQRAGDKMVASHIEALRDGPEDLQGSIDLAQRLAHCDGYVTQSRVKPDVVVLP